MTRTTASTGRIYFSGTNLLALLPIKTPGNEPIRRRPTIGQLMVPAVRYAIRPEASNMKAWKMSVPTNSLAVKRGKRKARETIINVPLPTEVKPTRKPTIAPTVIVMIGR